MALLLVVVLTGWACSEWRDAWSRTIVVVEDQPMRPAGWIE
jgi:hypothetical protein